MAHRNATATHMLHIYRVKPFVMIHTEIPTAVVVVFIINTYFIAVKWGQSQNNDVIISSKCIRDKNKEDMQYNFQTINGINHQT